MHRNLTRSCRARAASTAPKRIHLLLIEDARKGLEDIKAGRVHDADKAVAKLQQRRKSKRTIT